MEKGFVSDIEYSEFLEMTVLSDSTGFDVNRLIEVYEYLKNKRTELCSFLSGKRVIENANIDFLRVIFDRGYFLSKYNQATEDFLKSDYLAEEFKKEIYDILNGNCCSEQLLVLLNSERKLNSFSKDEIREIEESLHEALDTITDEEKKRKCEEIYEIFEDYIFVIDGIGPTEYIKEKNGIELSNIILEKSGVPSHASYYSGYGVDRRFLCEDHLFSIYKKIVKFYPDKADEFVRMVGFINRLTPTAFVTNYLWFVQNGMNSDFKHSEGNISVDGVHGNTRDLVGVVSIFHAFGTKQSDLDKRFEFETHYEIEKRFLQMVEEFKSSQEKNKGENTKVLSRIKQD